MYVAYCLLLWVFVYLLPALAFFPQLIFSPRTAFAAPIVSVLIVYVLTSFLIALKFFSTPIVTTSVIMMAGVAIFRLRLALTDRSLDPSKSQWSKQTIFIYLFHAIILFPYFIKLGTHAFDRGDEIYSWNFWAIQHYLLEPIDFSHTGAPYPQLFPKLLAFCYHLLGNLELQLPVKATLIIFPWSMLTAIAMSYLKPLLPYFAVYLMILIYVLAGSRLEQFFNDGYADPVMTSCLIVSAALFWFSQQKQNLRSHSNYPDPQFLGFLSVICGITAAHAKQAGLIWVMISLPLLLWFSAKQTTKPFFFRLLSLLAFLGGFCWLQGEGNQFYHNTGVIGLSFGDRDLISQLIYASNKYLIQKPFLFLLFAFAVWRSWRQKLLWKMMWFFMIPSLICWFLFGAYQLRLGQQIIAFAFWIIMASGPILSPKWNIIFKKWQTVLIGWPPRLRGVLATSAIFSFALGGLLFVKEVWVEKNGVSLYAGGKQSLHRYFAQDTDYIYKTIYSNPQALLWVPSRYLYGLFYHHTQLTTPDYRRTENYDQSALVEELQRKSPHYVFTVSPEIIDGPASAVLSSVVEQCPQAFIKVSSPNAKFGFITYRIHQPSLQQDPCLLALLSAKKLAEEDVAFSQ